MPIFGSRHDNAPVEPQRPVTPPHQSRSIFSRRSRSADHTEPSNTVNRSNTVHSPGSYGTNDHPNGNGSTRGGWFNRRRSSSSDGRDSSVGHDPSIMNARSKVADAEAAERDADQALHAARMAVREARDHVKMLEREAVEGTRRAKMKQEEAKKRQQECTRPRTPWLSCSSNAPCRDAVFCCAPHLQFLIPPYIHHRPTIE